MLDDFNVQDREKNKEKQRRRSLTDGDNNVIVPRRRQQIIGDVIDTDITSNRVEVVLKSESTRYLLLSVLKNHFLFQQKQSPQFYFDFRQIKKHLF